MKVLQLSGPIPREQFIAGGSGSSKSALASALDQMVTQTAGGFLSCADQVEVCLSPNQQNRGLRITSKTDADEAIRQLAERCLGGSETTGWEWDSDRKQKIDADTQKTPFLGGTTYLKEVVHPQHREQQTIWLEKVPQWLSDSLKTEPFKKKMRVLDPDFDPYIYASCSVLALESAYTTMEGHHQGLPIWFERTRSASSPVSKVGEGGSPAASSQGRKELFDVSAPQGSEENTPLSPECASYEVNVFPLGRTGMEFHVLTPLRARHELPRPALPVIIVFRGSAFDGVVQAAGETFKSNVHPNGVGKGVFEDCRESIQGAISTYLDAQGVQWANLIITGHSQGGAFATELGVFLKKSAALFGTIRVLTFNSPATGNSVGKDYDQTTAKPTIINFVNIFDSVPYLGQRVLGHDIFVVPSLSWLSTYCCGAVSLLAKFFHLVLKMDLYLGPLHTMNPLGSMCVWFLGKRELPKPHRLQPLVQWTLYLVTTAVLLVKRALVGHQAGSRFSCLWDYVACALDAMRGLLLDLIRVLHFAATILKSAYEAIKSAYFSFGCTLHRAMAVGPA